MAMGIASGGRRRGGRRSRRAPMVDINVTPLVDVMLVLLIIFMVTAPLLTSAVPVDLPESRAKALAEERDQVTISIQADGGIWLNEEQLAPGTLAERLTEFAPRDGGKPPLVTLRADRSLDYGRVMAVMGELNRAGFNAISLVTSGSATAP